MRVVEKSIDVNAPIGIAYSQWSRFENLPKFMRGVVDVTRLDDERMVWRVEVGGRIEEQEIEIVGMIPCESIAWRSTSGATSSWLVDFERLEPNRTRVVLHRSYDPEDAVGNTGDSTAASSSRLPFHDVASARIQADLQRFKEFIES